jgi:HEPN domain-containing protein
MDSQEKFEYWLESAQYDLDTAEAMFNTGRWFYVVFMCQQAIEKRVKGLYTIFKNDNVPRIHEIAILLKSFEGELSEPISDERYTFFIKLSTFYVNERYPDFKQKLSQKINIQNPKTILFETQEAFKWLLTLRK